MRVSSERYTVAWFTLAECVSRGEKERAFGVYRLLSHSLDDRALAVQLEGDLFCAFKLYAQAIEKYQTAALLYKQAERFLEAASVYEHICSLENNTLPFMQELLDCYSILQFELRVADLSKKIAELLIQGGLIDGIFDMAYAIDKLHSYGARASCYEAILAAAAAYSTFPVHVVRYLIDRIISCLIKHGDDQLLERFIATIKATQDTFYTIVLDTLNEQKQSKKNSAS